MTAEITSAFVENNAVAVSDLPSLIGRVHAALVEVTKDPVDAVELQPVVPVKKSITDDFLICLEDGKRFRSLKRHLMTHYDMTPDDYRKKWNLPANYPMVAPNYARRRSELAKQIGLGRGRALPEKNGKSSKK